MENNNLVLIAYAIYLPITILLTVFVSKKLFTNAKIFMLDIFSGKEEIASATNKLFEIGFYLLNIGFAFLILEIYSLATYQGMVETLAQKIGGFSVYLGIVLFANLFLLFRGRKVSKANRNNNHQLTI
ncbi:MAG: hypothetical protein ACPGVH_08330 [Chitinophagales bacterium]